MELTRASPPFECGGKVDVESHELKDSPDSDATVTTRSGSLAYDFDSSTFDSDDGMGVQWKRIQIIIYKND